MITKHRRFTLAVLLGVEDGLLEGSGGSLAISSVLWLVSEVDEFFNAELSCMSPVGVIWKMINQHFAKQVLHATCTRIHSRAWPGSTASTSSRPTALG